MEADLDLYPSEIARLVLGYHQEQNCEEAAKTFLETSPDLAEHRAVTKRNGTYGKKCNYKYQCKLSLLDILHEYCEISKIVLGKISEGPDYEQIKNKKLSEQIKYLLDGPRFVFNINVPTTQNTPSSSKVTHRKRNHSTNEQGKLIKSLNYVVKPSQKDCDNIEKSFENLTVHQTSTPTKLTNTETNVNIVNKEVCTDLNPSEDSPKKVESSLKKNNSSLDAPPSDVTSTSNKVQSAVIVQNKGLEISENNNSSVKTVEKCSASTSTEKLMDYCSTEVQTAPLCFLDQEPDIVDEPVQGLNLITKELLQRGELQEKIAENINKSIQSALASRKDNNVQDHNIVSLLEVNTTADSIANNEIFNGLLEELFQIESPVVEHSNFKSHPDLNDQPYTQFNNCIEENSADTINNDFNEPKENEEKSNAVPLKQRLRGSSKFQLPEEEKESLLENQNAEAIRNIVNVISKNKTPQTNDEPGAADIQTETIPENLNDVLSQTEDIYLENNPPKNNLENEPMQNNLGNESAQNNLENEPAQNNLENELTQNNLQNNSQPNDFQTTEIGQKTKKPRKIQQKNKTGNEPAKKKKKRIPKPKSEVIVENPDVGVQTVPTLIYCSEPYKDVPIAPKKTVETAQIMAPPVASLYLKTVEVPCHLLTPAQIEANKSNPLLQKTLHQTVFSPQKQALLFSPQKLYSPKISNQQVILSTPLNEPICLPIASGSSKIPVESVITLYSSDNSAETRVTPISDIPMSFENAYSIDIIGSGLSPYFKQTLPSSGNFENISQATEKYQERNNQLKEVTVTTSTISEVSEPVLDFNEQVAKQKSSEIFVENSQTEELIGLSTNNEDDTNPNRSRAADAIIKNTPQSIMEARSDNNRLSLSTPRRRNSHVRALFNTPMKLTADVDTSQPSAKVKSACRGSLFKSPPFSGEVPPVKLDTILEEITVGSANTTTDTVNTLSPVKRLIVPIATKSPTPKLQGNWSKVTGMGLILGESSPEKTQSDSSAVKVEQPIEIKRAAKKSWDEDLRKIVGAAAEAAKPTRVKPPPKKTRKKKIEASNDEQMETEVTDQPKKRGRKRKLTNDVDKKEEEKNANENEQQPVKKRRQTRAKKTNEEKNLKIEIKNEPTKGLEESTEQNENDEKPARNTRKQTRNKQLNAKKNQHAEVALNTTKESKSENNKKKPNEITPPAPIPVSKKTASKSSEKKKFFKSPESTNLKMDGPSLPCLDLETPQKTESDLRVPATPRVLYTPAESLIKSSRFKPSSDKSIKCGIDTPCLDHPPKTPCVILTPKIVDEDNDKKPSPYYEPSEEIRSKDVIDSEKITAEKQITVQKNLVELNDNKAVEITRYGVVHNKVATSESSMPENKKPEESKLIEPMEVDEEIPEVMNISVHTDTDSDNESAKSHSSSSSSSSTSSSSSSGSSTSSDSSSSSSSNDSTSSFPSPVKSQESFTEAEESHPVVEYQPTDHETEESEMEIRLQQDSSHDERDDESSPKKVFAILKDTTEEIGKETPAKDENAVEEAKMSETPVSNSDRVALQLQTSMNNMSSEISAIIKPLQDSCSTGKPVSTHQSNNLSTSKEMSSNKPKIIDVKKVEVGNSLARSLNLKEKMDRVKATLKDDKSSNQKKQNSNSKLKKVTMLKKNPDVEKRVCSAAKNLESDVTLPENKKEEKNDLIKSKVRTSPRKTIKQSDDLDVESKLEKMFSGPDAKVTAIIPVVSENSKGISKAKVDSVKRDLFSDEEINDQRTTRSKTARLIIGNQKVEECLDDKKSQETEVLEYLELNKINPEMKTNDEEKICEENSLKDESMTFKNCAEFTVVYNEMSPPKHKKQEAFCEAEINLHYLEYKYDEEIGLSTVSQLFYLLDSPPKLDSSLKFITDTNQEILTPKQSPMKRKDKVLVKENEKSRTVFTDKNEKKTNKNSHSEKNKKANRRKMPLTKENNEGNKSKPDPQNLFKNLDLEEFLNTVHESDS